LQILQDYLYVLRLRQYSVVTVKSYEVNVTKYLIFCSSRRSDLFKLDTFLARQYYSYLKSSESPYSINNALSAVRGFYNYLVANEQVDYNYFNSLHNLFVQRNPPKTIPFSQLKYILDRIDNGQYNSLRDIAVFELVYGSGIKASELVNLKDEDLNLEKEEMQVRTRRVRYWQPRIVYLPAGSIYVLKKYLTYKRMRWPTSEYIFPKKNGKKYSNSALYSVITSFLGKKHGTKVLRQTYIQHLISNGADLLYIRELIGHRSVKSMMLYKLPGYSILQVYRQSFPREVGYRA